MVCQLTSKLNITSIQKHKQQVSLSLILSPLPSLIKTTMGSEQSSHGNTSNKHAENSRQEYRAKKQHTIANPGGSEAAPDVRSGSSSPGPSVCSDSDLPYISYTVNRPIGDSPKLTNKPTAKSRPLRKLPQKLIKKSTHNIVVVKPASNAPGVEKDPDVVTLQSIPMFLPIMRATLNLPAVRDPEVLERLDPAPLYKFCFRYQNYMTTCANLVGTEQDAITQKIKETDKEISEIFDNAVKKQKRFAKYAGKLEKVQEVSHQLSRCHMVLNQILESIETLNNQLKIEDRLEPFVWTTG